MTLLETYSTHGRRWQRDTCATCTHEITWSPRYGWRHDLTPATADHKPTPASPGKTGHESR